MGRDSYSRRAILEYSAGVRIQDLINFGLTQKPCQGSGNINITQNECEHLASVTITVRILNRDRLSDKNFIQFEYDYQGRHLSFKQPIEIQPVHLGGYRYFFRCNCTKNGQYCGRRVKALYFGGHIWACRHCLELSYVLSRYHRAGTGALTNLSNIYEKKAERLRQANHPRKANKALWKAYDYGQKADESFYGRIMKLTGMK